MKEWGLSREVLSQNDAKIEFQTPAGIILLLEISCYDDLGEKRGENKLFDML